MRRKHIIAACIVSAISMSPAFAAEKPTFLEDGKFSVCVDPTFPPMEFMANEADKEPSGFDIDLAKALGEAWGTKADFQIMDFNGLLPSLAGGRCDMIASGMLGSDERRKTMDTVGYLNTFIVIIGKAGTPPLKSIDELSGKTLAVQSGTTYGARVLDATKDFAGKGLAPVVLQEYVKQTDAIQQILIGRAFGALSQDTEISYRESQTPGQFTTLFVLPQSKFEPYSIIMPQGSKDTPVVQATISELLSNGKLSAIAATWNMSPKQLEGIGK